MYYGAVKYTDIANGIGCRTTLFVSGCRNHCKDCFQPETWAFDYGKPFTKDVEFKIIESLKRDYIDGLTILGGEPFEPENQKDLLPFIKRVRREKPDATIWMYSGYTWEELIDPFNARCHTDETKDILSNVNILVDGKFDETQKDISLRFRGSRNQRVINVPMSIKGIEKHEIVISEYNNK